MIFDTTLFDCVSFFLWVWFKCLLLVWDGYADTFQRYRLKVDWILWGLKFNSLLDYIVLFMNFLGVVYELYQLNLLVQSLLSLFMFYHFKIYEK